MYTLLNGMPDGEIFSNIVEIDSPSAQNWSGFLKIRLALKSSTNATNIHNNRADHQ